MDVAIKSIRLENFFGKGLDLYWNSDMPGGDNFIDGLLNETEGEGEHRRWSLGILATIIRHLDRDDDRVISDDTIWYGDLPDVVKDTRCNFIPRPKRDYDLPDVAKGTRLNDVMPRPERPYTKFLITIEFSNAARPSRLYKWHLEGVDHKGIVDEVTEYIEFSKNGEPYTVSQGPSGKPEFWVENGIGVWMVPVNSRKLSERVGVNWTEYSDDSFAGYALWFGKSNQISPVREGLRSIADAVYSSKVINNTLQSEV